MWTELGLTPTSILATTLVLLTGLVTLRWLNSATRLPKSLPRYYIGGDKDTKTSNSHVSTVFPTVVDAIQHAYPRFRNSAFVLKGKRPDVWTDTVIVPPAWVDSLKNLPDGQLSFLDGANDQFNFDLVYVAIRGSENHHAFIKSVSVDLTRHLSKIMADMDDELIHAFNTLIPACDDWTAVYPMQVLPQIVALASGRIFVGAPLHRDPEFMKATITFTMDAFSGSEQLNSYPLWLRPHIAPFLKKVKICKQQHHTMRRLLKSHLQERHAMALRGEELPMDVMTWIIKNSPEESKFDLEHQAQCQLNISLAAIHTTTITASNAWLDLCERQEYIEPLLNEWTEVLATEPTGIISKHSMPRLKKLDSFLKESQRLNPLGALSFGRKVKSEFSLPDGTTLPKGSYIAVGAQAVALDGNLWKNPEQFDGYRFEKLRQEPGSENRHQFATTGQDSLFFGHGKHACPGRFFAANEIKLILAYILRNYDMKFPEGQGRPAQIRAAGGNIPDYTKPIMLRRKQKTT